MEAGDFTAPDLAGTASDDSSFLPCPALSIEERTAHLISLVLPCRQDRPRAVLLPPSLPLNPAHAPSVPHLLDRPGDPGARKAGKREKDVDDRVKVGLRRWGRDEELKEVEEADRGVDSLAGWRRRASDGRLGECRLAKEDVRASTRRACRRWASLTQGTTAGVGRSTT